MVSLGDSVLTEPNKYLCACLCICIWVRICRVENSGHQRIVEWSPWVTGELTEPNLAPNKSSCWKIGICSVTISGEKWTNLRRDKMNVMNLVLSDQRRRENMFTLNLSDTCRQDLRTQLCWNEKEKNTFLLQNCPKLMIFPDRISKHSAEAWFELPYFPKLQRITLLPLRIALHSLAYPIVLHCIVLHSSLSGKVYCKVVLCNGVCTGWLTDWRPLSL